MAQNRVEELIQKMMTEKPGGYQNEFMEALMQEKVLMPAVLPKNTSPELIKKLMDNIGKQQDVPEGVHPQPCLLNDKSGKNYLPVFTSEKEMKKNAKAPKFPLTLTLPFKTCTQILNDNPNIEGIVVNAFTHNIIVQRNHADSQNQPQTIQVTAEQYHFLARQKMESDFLPKTLFEKKQEFIDNMTAQRGNYIKELYEQVYDGELACPYTAEEFEVMSLNISEELVLLQIGMPKKNLQPGICSSCIIGWNSEKEESWYYAILTGKPEEGSSLMQVFPDGRKERVADAPSEGTELTTVLDYIQTV